MTYVEYKSKRQNEFNALPIFFAFSQEQFDKILRENEIPAEDVRGIGGGGFFRKDDADKITAFLDKTDELPGLMKNYDFAVDAFYYEMCNHEYGINYYQRNWDVLTSIYGDIIEYMPDDDFNVYADKLDLNETTRKAYNDARKKYYKDATEQEWF